MFYPEHVRKIYRPAFADENTMYDPLAVERTLVRATRGNLAGLVSDWQAPSDGVGDVSEGSRERNALTSAEAEEQLVRAARAAFSLPPFPESPDAVALEYLLDFLEWMEGKGLRAANTQSSHTTVPVA